LRPTPSEPGAATQIGLYLLTYQRDGRLAGMAVVSAHSMTSARMFTVSGFADAALDQVYALDPEVATLVPSELVGRMLSRKEGGELLHLIARGTGQVR
jgi:hypothetical protein